MATFKAYFRKERLEAIRQQRYIILAVGIIAFAIIEPFALRILPKLLQDQIPGDIQSLFDATPRFAINNYIKDLTQIGYLFVIFTLSGILRDEINQERLVFPYSQGANPTGMVLAKAVHYILTLLIHILLGFIIVYYYGGMILEGEQASILEVVKSTLSVGMYYVFTLSLIIFLSSALKKSMVVGFTALFISLSQSFLIKVEGIAEWLPYQLIIYANNFTLKDSLLTFFVTILLSILLVALGIYRMHRAEVI